MTGAALAVNWSQIGPVLFGLLCFGLAYNALMAHLGERKAGYTAVFVVGGVLVTLLGLALIDWAAALLALGCFSASGLPMVLGDMYRSMRLREKALQAMRQQAMQEAGRE